VKGCRADLGIMTELWELVRNFFKRGFTYLLDFGYYGGL